MQRILGAALVMVGAVTTPTAAAAQQHHGQQPGMRTDHGAMPGMALVREFAPGALLEKREALGLSDDQVARLTALAAETATAREHALTTHDTRRDQLRSALMAPAPDLATVRTHFDAAHAAMGHAHWLGIDATIRAMAVLTDEQRAEVRTTIGQGESGRPMVGGGWTAKPGGSMPGAVGCQSQTAAAGTPGRGHHHGADVCGCCGSRP